MSGTADAVPFSFWRRSTLCRGSSGGRRIWRRRRSNGLVKTETLRRRQRAGITISGAHQAHLIDLLLPLEREVVETNGHAAQPIGLRLGQPTLLVEGA